MTAILPEQPVQIKPEIKAAGSENLRSDSASGENSFDNRFEEKIKKLQENGKQEETEPAENSEKSKIVSETSGEEKETEKSENKKEALLRFFSRQEKKSSGEEKAAVIKKDKGSESGSEAEKKSAVTTQDMKADDGTIIDFNSIKKIINENSDITSGETDSESDAESSDEKILLADASLKSDTAPVDIKIPFKAKTSEKKNAAEADSRIAVKSGKTDEKAAVQGKKDTRTVIVEDKRTISKVQDKIQTVNVTEEKAVTEEAVKATEADSSGDGKLLKQAPEVKELTVFLGESNVSAEGDGGKIQAPVTRLLSQQLKNQTNQDIAKNINFIMKDNNQGEIKLILKPEALGQVKIHLDLNENNIVGRIVVENNSVRQAFNENLASLSEALKEQGFENAALDVSVGERDGEKQQQQNGQNKPYYSERLRQWDDVVPTVGEQEIFGGTGHIDLVV